MKFDNLFLDKLKIPPRSTLYNLEPIGLGTPYAESLTSYISRLSQSHNLKVTTLVCKTFTTLVNKEYIEQAFQTGGFGSSIRYINGNSPVSLEYVSALEELTTRKDLLYLTMNSWSGLFSKNVIGDTRKWCPICLEELKSNGKEVYEPLIWYIKGIDTCDRHQVKLEDKCTNCGKKLQFLHNNLIVGHCQYCSVWLGRDNQKNSTNLSEYEIFLFNTFKPLIENALGLQYIPTKWKIGHVLNKVMKENNFISVTQFAKYFDIHQTMLSNWINNKAKPSIESMFKISNKLNLSIYELFYCNQNWSNINIQGKKSFKRSLLSVKEIENELRKAINDKRNISLHKLSNEKNFSYMTAKRNFPSLCERLKAAYKTNNKVEEILRKDEIDKKLMATLELEPPISFMQFSINTGIPIVNAKRYSPELSKKVIDRYLKFRAEEKAKRFRVIEEEIRNVIFELDRNGIYPGIKTVQKKLSDPNYFIKKEFRTVWEIELEKLGYKNKV
nr:TniQ family protein [Paenibacillus bovis]